MNELSPALERLREFYCQSLALPAHVVMAHAPGLIDKPAFFTFSHLQHHLNNPLLTPSWFSLIWQGKSIDCNPALGHKVIRGAEVTFLNKSIIQEGLSRGASLVLEGIEFLEPDINSLCAAIDAQHRNVMSNAVVFYSQRGMEAYRGHFDAQDTLVIHLRGQKKWRIHERLAPRRVNRGELTPEQMGRLHAEIIMNPGDALFLRSHAPHIVETTGNYSLHMSFDICDHNIGANAALDMLLKEYQSAPAPPYAPVKDVVEKLALHAQSPALRQRIAARQAETEARDKNTRARTGTNRITYFERLAGASDAAAKPEISSPAREK